MNEKRIAAEMLEIREMAGHDRQAVQKWGRMLNALIEVLAEKDVTDKAEVMAKVYERLNHEVAASMPEGA